MQVSYILKDLTKLLSHSPRYLEYITETLCREYGVPYLTTVPKHIIGYRDYESEIYNFITLEKDVTKVLDLIELAFRVAEESANAIDVQYGKHHFQEKVGALIIELNERFKEHGIGYQYVERVIIRMDSTFVHEEVVKHALTLIQRKGFENINIEFMAAFKHFREGSNSGAMNECLKAFESTMRIICEKQHWSYPSSPTASKLIDICIGNGLIPEYWSSHFSSLQCMLKSSVPMLRNKESGHGAGSQPKNIPDYLVSYMLGMTAATIVFLISAENGLK